jgi:hypothetical protein
MRRTALFCVLLFVASSFMVGCQPSKDSGPRSGGEWQELSGTIKPLGVSIYPEGSHRLEKDDALVVIIQSTRYNLTQFEEFEVTVAGKVRDMDPGDQQVMDVEQLTVITEADENLKQMKTFVSRYNTYHLEYPQLWPESEETQKALTFLKEDKEHNFFSVFVIETDVSFADWLKDLSFDDFTFDVETLIRVDGKNATRRIYRRVLDSRPSLELLKPILLQTQNLTMRMR